MDCFGNLGSFYNRLLLEFFPFNKFGTLTGFDNFTFIKFQSPLDVDIFI